jgi:hypothetical protein
MMQLRHSLLLCSLLLGGLMALLAACGGNATPEPTLAPPTLAVAEVLPSATPLATATLPLPPTMAAPPTATIIPTATPLPGVNLLTAADFGDNRNPLTGEEVEDTAVLQRRPLAVKITNAPAMAVRPQSGLNDADIVFEHITEAVVTRFTAIFLSKEPPTIGPIRSARLIDVELPAMYDAALAYSGSGIGVGQKLFATEFRDRILRPASRGYYRTGDTTKAVEHTFYAYPDRLRETLTEMGQNQPPNYTGERMTFTSEPPAGGTPASRIDLDYRTETVTWEYDPVTNLYYRTAANVPHLDGNTQEQVRARNVAVIFANHVTDASICEQVSAEGLCQLFTVEIQLWGQGQAVVFRDGQRYDGIWKRDARNDMLTFYDNSGNPIPLQIGNSWMQVMSIYYDNPLEVTE